MTASRRSRSTDSGSPTSWGNSTLMATSPSVRGHAPIDVRHPARRRSPLDAVSPAERPAGEAQVGRNRGRGGSVHGQVPRRLGGVGHGGCYLHAGVSSGDGSGAARQTAQYAPAAAGSQPGEDQARFRTPESRHTSSSAGRMLSTGNCTVIAGPPCEVPESSHQAVSSLREWDDGALRRTAVRRHPFSGG